MISLFWLEHVLRADEGVELRFGEESERNSGLLEGDIFRVRLFGDFGGVIVPDMRVQGRYQHQGIVQVIFDVFQVGFNPNHTVICEVLARIRKQSNGLQQVEYHEGFIDVKFEVPAGAREVDGRIVAHDLGADHAQSLALGRIDFAGHDGTARFVFGQVELPYAAARP